MNRKRGILLLGILGFTILSVQGQWFYRNCNVRSLVAIPQEAFDCLWEKSGTVKTVGKIGSLVGTSVAVAGGVTMAVSDPCCASGRFLIGGLVMITGLGIDALFLPVWAVGASRRSQLMNTEIYKVRQRTSLRISPSVGNIEASDHGLYLGLSASLRF